MAVENINEFHRLNLLKNKEHYTRMNRVTKNFIVNFFQTKGAKVHFNYGIKMIDEELGQQTGEVEEVIVS